MERYIAVFRGGTLDGTEREEAWIGGPANVLLGQREGNLTPRYKLVCPTDTEWDTRRFTYEPTAPDLETDG